MPACSTAALREAKERYHALAVRFLDGDAAVSEADCLAAKDEVDRAENAARAAFRRAFKPQAEPS